MSKKPKKINPKKWGYPTPTTRLRLALTMAVCGAVVWCVLGAWFACLVVLDLWVWIRSSSHPLHIFCLQQRETIEYLNIFGVMLLKKEKEPKKLSTKLREILTDIFVETLIGTAFKICLIFWFQTFRLGWRAYGFTSTPSCLLILRSMKWWKWRKRVWRLRE